MSCVLRAVQSSLLFSPLHSWNSEVVCRFCLVIVFHFFLDAWEGAKVSLECRGKERCEWCKQATWTLSRVVKLPRRFAQGAIPILPAVKGRTLLTCLTSRDLVRAAHLVEASMSATLFTFFLFFISSGQHLCTHTHTWHKVWYYFLPHSMAWLPHLLWSGWGLQGTFSFPSFPIANSAWKSRVGAHAIHFLALL